MAAVGKESFRFMADLYQNNNKSWFDANRKRYEQHVRQPMKALAEALADPVSLILPEFSGEAKLSRINNDIRFSPNKPPYKEHVWISFGKNASHCADLFAAIDRHGWTTGVGVFGPRREALDGWRLNLLKYADAWRAYARAIGSGQKALVHPENPYKKPLYPDIPADLRDLIQARGVWIYQSPRTAFQDSLHEDFFRGLCHYLPAYLFMTVAPRDLSARLSGLSRTIIAPDLQIDSLWRIFQD